MKSRFILHDSKLITCSYEVRQMLVFVQTAEKEDVHLEWAHTHPWCN